MPKAVSLVDTLRWTDGTGAIMSLDGKGLTVELPADEFDRLLAAGAVAKPGKSGGSKAADESDPDA